MFILQTIIGIFLLILVPLNIYDKKKETCVYTVVGLVLGILLVFCGGLNGPRINDSFLVISSINQTDKYIVRTKQNIVIYYKDCSYRPGDTLWIKK
jgi:uncharacterized membrane protein